MKGHLAVYNHAGTSVNGSVTNSTQNHQKPRIPRTLDRTLRLIRTLMKRDGFAWARVAYISRTLQTSPRTVGRHLQQLTELGYIVRSRTGNDWYIDAGPLFFDVSVSDACPTNGECFGDSVSTVCPTPLPYKGIMNPESPMLKAETSKQAPVGAVVAVVVQANASLPERVDPCEVGKTSAAPEDAVLSGHEIAADPPSAGENVMPPLPRHTPPQERTPQSIRTQPMTAQTTPQRANSGERVQSASETNVEALAAQLQVAGLADAAACRRHAENNPALVRAWLAALPDNLKNTGGFLRSRLDAGVMPPDTSTPSDEPRTERRPSTRRDDGPFAGCDRLERLRDIPSIRLGAIAMARAAIKQGYVGG